MPRPFLALFYTREEIGLRLAYYFGFAAFAGAFGGLIAFGVQHVHTAFAKWKLLFLIEGIPSVLTGLLAMTILPNRPEETCIFDEKERALAVERMNRGTKADVGRMLQKGHISAAFKDWRVRVPPLRLTITACGLTAKAPLTDLCGGGDVLCGE